MARHTPPSHVIVVGGSAGALPALTTIVERLPPSFPACVLVVMHSASNGSNGVLPELLGRAGSLPVAFANDGDRLRAGRIYVAPADYHLVVARGALAVVHGPRENGFRPAIDPLFRTAAREFRGSVIGVVLSGALSDGTYGLSVVKHYGGVAIVQDPEDAVIPSMPQSALKHVEVDLVVPAAAIAAAIERLVASTVKAQRGSAMPRGTALEPQLQSDTTEVAHMKDLFGAPSGLTCPDCGGALWEVEEDKVLRYQCHVGHQYAPENLEDGQRDVIDGALWSAVRVLEEHAELKMRMADRAATGGMRMVSEGFTEGAREARHQAEQIRALLLTGRPGDAKRSGTRSTQQRAGRRQKKSVPSPRGAASLRQRTRRKET